MTIAPKDGPLLPFLEVEQGELERRRIYALRQDLVRSQRTGTGFRVDRLFCADWVNVVAFTADDELILVRQWRFGSRSFSVEIPAGGLEPGEDPIVGGLRELVEETGYTPDDPAAVVVVGATRPNPAFMANRCHTVFVPRATRTAPQRLDPTEEVEVLKMPRADLDALLLQGARRAGQVSDARRGAGVDRAGDDVPDDVLDDVLDSALVVVALQLWRLHVSAVEHGVEHGQR